MYFPELALGSGMGFVIWDWKCLCFPKLWEGPVLIQTRNGGFPELGPEAFLTWEWRHQTRVSERFVTKYSPMTSKIHNKLDILTDALCRNAICPPPVLSSSAIPFPVLRTILDRTGDGMGMRDATASGMIIPHPSPIRIPVSSPVAYPLVPFQATPHPQHHPHLNRAPLRVPIPFLVSCLSASPLRHTVGKRRCAQHQPGLDRMAKQHLRKH